MALEDYLEPEVAVTAAVAAAVFSPQVRGLLRRGLVLATAGVLMAGDALGSFGRGVSQGMQEVKASAEETADRAENSAATASTASNGSAPERRRSHAKGRAEAANAGNGEGEA